MSMAQMYKQSLDDYILYLEQYRASLEDVPEESMLWSNIVRSGVFAFNSARTLDQFPPEPPPPPSSPRDR